MARKPDRVTLTFKTKRFEGFATALLAEMLGRGRLTQKAINQVIDQELLPAVRERTPVGETGNARAGWKRGKEGKDRKGRVFSEVTNPVFYIPWLEFGTLGARKKKLKKRTLIRRRQKAARGKKTVGAGLSGEGGIRPIGMLKTTIRELRAKNAVHRELEAMLRVGINRASRQTA